MFDLLWDLHQGRRIGEAQDGANQAARKATDFQERVRFLEDRLDRMLLQNMAMWSLLRDTVGLTDQDLINRVQEIDLQDGTADGKVTRTAPTTCPRCQRAFSSRHQRCLYCGHQAPAKTPFDGR